MIIRDVRLELFERSQRTLFWRKIYYRRAKFTFDPAIRFMPIRVGNPTLRTGSWRSSLQTLRRGDSISMTRVRPYVRVTLAINVSVLAQKSR